MTALGIRQYLGKSPALVMTVDAQQDALAAVEQGEIAALAAQSGYGIGYETIRFIAENRGDESGRLEDRILDADILTTDNVKSRGTEELAEDNGKNRETEEMPENSRKSRGTEEMPEDSKKSRETEEMLEDSRKNRETEEMPEDSRKSRETKEMLEDGRKSRETEEMPEDI